MDSMTSHSPTPWRREDDTILDSEGAIIYEEAFPHGSDSGVNLTRINLQHIVDCVNRCHELEKFRDSLVVWNNDVTEHMPAVVAEETRRLAEANQALTSEELSSN